VLFVAGCAGVSILIKVIGAYYIAGVLLFLGSLNKAMSRVTIRAIRKHQGWRKRDPSDIQHGALLLFLATVLMCFTRGSKRRVLPFRFARVA